MTEATETYFEVLTYVGFDEYSRKTDSAEREPGEYSIERRELDYY